MPFVFPDDAGSRMAALMFTINFSAECEDTMCINVPQSASDCEYSVASCSQDPDSAALLEAQWSPSDKGIVAHALAAL